MPPSSHPTKNCSSLWETKAHLTFLTNPEKILKELVARGRSAGNGGRIELTTSKRQERCARKRHSSLTHGGAVSCTLC